jgi:hypothetical protein
MPSTTFLSFVGVQAWVTALSVRFGTFKQPFGLHHRRVALDGEGVDLQQNGADINILQSFIGNFGWKSRSKGCSAHKTIVPQPTAPTNR